MYPKIYTNVYVKDAKQNKTKITDDLSKVRIKTFCRTLSTNKGVTNCMSVYIYMYPSRVSNPLNQIGPN